MFRILPTLLIACCLIPTSLHAQERERFGQRILQPFRDIADATEETCLNCKLGGRLCPKHAEWKRERRLENAQEKALAKKRKEVEAKQLELEEMKIDREKKELEKLEAEENKPWDVADPENLESPSELLQQAAALKQQEDLAPKKREALEYLASLGCLNFEGVAAAILTGLNDNNESVRAAAVNVILSRVQGGQSFAPAYPPGTMLPPNAQLPPATHLNPDGHVHVSQGACGCGGHGFVNQQAQAPCQGCLGTGCDGCNFSGQTVQVFTQPCQVCNPQPTNCGCAAGTDNCLNCCSPEIVKKLKEMLAPHQAPEKEQLGCKGEPSAHVRMLAQRALELCPQKAKEEDAPPKPPKKDTVEELIESIENGGGSGDTNESEGTEGTDSGITTRRIKPPTQPVSYRTPKPQSLFIASTLEGYVGANKVRIRFSSGYQLPLSAVVFLKSNGNAFHGIIVESTPGYVTVQLVEQNAQTSLRAGAALSLGVVDETE